MLNCSCFPEAGHGTKKFETTHVCPGIPNLTGVDGLQQRDLREVHALGDGFLRTLELALQVLL